MTCEEFTRLRFLELVFWARKRYGAKAWREQFCRECGINRHRRIKIETFARVAWIIQPFETWARDRGFKSRYDNGPHEHHATILTDFLTRNNKAANDRLRDSEQDELFAGLGFHSTPQEVGSELRPGKMPGFFRES